MKEKLVALFLIIVMVASTLTAIAATTATPVAAATSTKATLTVSKTNPVIGQNVTFTAQLQKWTGKTWVAIPKQSTPQLKIGHLVNGVMVTDVAKTTNASGKITWQKSWSKAGSTTYYATFAGSPTYVKSSSTGKTVTVKIGTKITQFMVMGQKGNPFVEGYLKDQNGKPVVGATVGVYGGKNKTSLSFLKNVKAIQDGSFSTAFSGSQAVNTYYQARFLGNQTYVPANGAVFHWIPYVPPLIQTKFIQLVVYGQGQDAYFDGILQDQNGHPVAGATVAIYAGQSQNSLSLNRQVTTDATGWFSGITAGPTPKYVQVKFLGDSTYAAVSSVVYTITTPTDIGFIVLGPHGGPLTFQGKLSYQNGNPLVGKTVTIYYGPSQTSLSSKLDTTTGQDGIFYGSIPLANYYQAKFTGDSTYAASESAIIAPQFTDV